MPILLAWLSLCGPARPQRVGLDEASVGLLAVHDHVRFDFHTPVLNDPYPHEFIQGYAFDGGDDSFRFDWHWAETPLRTRLRVTPLARAHFAFDQDTDFTPTTTFTHGDAGRARSRTVGIDQGVPLFRLTRFARVWNDLGFERQWTRFYEVTTYDLNSNPALPSRAYSRVISERAIVFAVSEAVELDAVLTRHGWQFESETSALPIVGVRLHNYIPVVLAASATTAYGFGQSFAVSRGIAGLLLRAGADAQWFNSYSSAHGYRRETFALFATLGRQCRR